MKSPPIAEHDVADAIITHSWGRIAYSIVRSLGRAGLKVGAGADALSGMARLSRYNAFPFRHPSHIHAPEDFVECVRAVVTRLAARVLIPSYDDAFVLAKYRHRFDDLDLSIPIAPLETIRTLHLKDRSTALAAGLGIPVPMTVVPSDIGDVAHFARHCGGSFVLKRLSSSAARGVHLMDESVLGGLPEWLARQQLEFGSFLLQAYVGGSGYGVSMLLNEGKLRARFSHKRLAEMHGAGGISTARVSVVQPLLEEYAEALLTHTRYHGVAMVEFRYDEQAKQAWMLEVNPRFWGSVGLAVQSGVDFPHLLFRMATEGDIEPVLQYRTGVVVKWLLGDAVRIARLAFRPRFPQNGRTMAPECDGYDDFFWDDPLVFPSEVWLSARKFVSTLRASPADADVVM